MTSFTDVFGGDTIPPSQYSYATYTVATNSELVWPEQYSGTDLLCADILELDVTVAALTVTLPPANEASVGKDILIRNIGSESVDIVDSASGAVVTIAAGVSNYVYITDNSTAAGTWSTFTFGTGTSAADASALAGLGLQASSGKLRIYLAYVGKSSDYSVVSTDRARFINVTSGTITLSLPSAPTVGEGFWFALRNSGAGSVTVEGAGIETINGSLNITVNQNESMLISTDGAAWYSIGQGKDATFIFSEYVVNSSASVVLTSGDVAGRMIRIAGTATANISVTLPGIDNIYFVNTEAGLGAYEVTFTTGSGSVVTLLASQRTALYCDGVNVSTAISTTLISSLSLADGSPVAPSINYDLDHDTGFYRDSSGVIGVTSNGVSIGTFDANGWNGSVVGGTVTGLDSALAIADGGTAATTAGGARTSLGLGNVDNTSDANKPISTATQTALDLKLDEYTFTTTAISKTVADREWCSVTTATKTITLPAAPAVGTELVISVGGFSDTVVGRNGSTIRGVADDVVINQSDATIRFVYADGTWRVS